MAKSKKSKKQFLQENFSMVAGILNILHQDFLADMKNISEDTMVEDVEEAMAFVKEEEEDGREEKNKLRNIMG